METVAIYGHEDRYSQHRWGAEQSFLLEKEAAASPISAYLDIDQIIKIAKENEVRPSCRSAPPEIAAAVTSRGHSLRREPRSQHFAHPLASTPRAALRA